MKKRYDIFIVMAVLLCAGFYAMPFGYPSYSCSMGGFSLTGGPGAYRLSGPLYMPLPGYSYVFSPIAVYGSEAEGTLTLIAPQNTLGRADTPRLAWVPPLGVDFGFPAGVALHRLTITINNATIRANNKITCLELRT